MMGRHSRHHGVPLASKIRTLAAFVVCCSMSIGGLVLAHYVEDRKIYDDHVAAQKVETFESEELARAELNRLLRTTVTAAQRDVLEFWHAHDTDLFDVEFLIIDDGGATRTVDCLPSDNPDAAVAWACDGWKPRIVVYAPAVRRLIERFGEKIVFLIIGHEAAHLGLYRTGSQWGGQYAELQADCAAGEFLMGETVRGRLTTDYLVNVLDGMFGKDSPRKSAAMYGHLVFDYTLDSCRTLTWENLRPL